MKKTYIYSMMAAAMAMGFTACTGEEDDLFDQSAAERLNQTSDVYSARLQAQPNGWAMQLYPTTDSEAPYGSGYLLLLRFADDKSVNVAMNNKFTGDEFRQATSAWEVIADNGPVLTFNTYNANLHAFSDPEDIPWTGTAEQRNNEQGEGCQGDYEYIIVDAPTDASYMMLKGKKRGTYNLLTPLEVGVDYEQYLADVKAFQAEMFAHTQTYNVIHFGDSVYKMVNAQEGIPNIYPFDGDEVTDARFNPFLVTKRGNDYYLRFRDAIDWIEGVKVQDFRYNTETDRFESQENSAFFIQGDTAMNVFGPSLDSKDIWVIDTTQVCDSMRQVLAEIRAELTAVKRPMPVFDLRNLGTKYVLRATMTGKQDPEFTFEATPEEDGVTYQYVQPNNNNARLLLNSLAKSTQKLLDMLSRRFRVEAAASNFNLSRLRLVATDNPDVYINISK